MRIIEYIRWTAKSVGRVRLSVIAACVLGVLRVATSLTFIWISKLLVDAATVGSDVSVTRIVHLAIIMTALMLIEMAFSLAGSYIQNKSEVELKNLLRHKIYSHLLGTYWASHDRVHSGDLTNRLTEDVRVIAEIVCRKLPDIIVMLIQLGAAFTMLCLMSWKLAVCVIFIMPFFVLISKVYVKRTRKITSEVRKYDSEVQASLQEGVQHHLAVQTLESEKFMTDRLNDLQSSVYDWTMSRTRFGVYSRAMIRLGFIGCYLTAFFWSVWHLHTGVITYGTMTAFLQLVARIQFPIVNMSQLVPSFVHSLTSIDRLAEIEGWASEDKGEDVMLDKPVGISFDNVTFSYEEGGRKILDSFSYDFAPGSKTVVMGETGIGKSTFVKILLALLTPQSGAVTLYNANRQCKVSASTRCNMAYVPQGNSLLDGTIRDNLLMGAPEATEAEMREALHVAVADFVFDMPDGLDSRIGELGAGLSEGQAQRIAIARALLRKKSVLLLDEFNSSLDETTSELLIKRMIESERESTVIFISHRKDITAYCDNVLQFS